MHVYMCVYIYNCYLLSRFLERIQDNCLKLKAMEFKF